MYPHVINNWNSAHPTKRRLVQKLLDEGRLEITTGGWVMTDEATSHIFAMVDQLIQGTLLIYYLFFIALKK